MACFQPEHVDWFFGRAVETGELAQLVSGLYLAGGGLQLVVGASGSGKSSLLRAGLVPALENTHRSGPVALHTVLMTPGPHPVAELAAKLATLTGVPEREIADALGAEPARVVRWVRDSYESDAVIEPTETSGGAALVRHSLVLVVDQLEEMFTAGADVAERQAFATALCALSEEGAGLVVVAGLRADFYGHLLRYPDLVGVIGHNQVTVTAMRQAQLREAITQPARRAGIGVDDELVELLLRDISSPPGGPALDAGVLPLLSHALYATYAHTSGRQLTVAAYQQVGGIAGAIAKTAGDVLDSLSVDRQDIARRLFLSLIHVAEDTADTRRRLSVKELVASCAGVRPTELDEVLDRFVAQRLITVDRNTVQISHEALLVAWPKLREWLDADRTSLFVERQVDQAASTWRRDRHNPADLYRGTRLAAAQEWARDRRDVSPLTAEFLEASSRQARRGTRRMYQTMAALVALVVTATIAMTVALNQRAEAVALRKAAINQRDLALSRVVADHAIALRARDVSLSRQLALIAYRIAPTPEARAALIDATALTPAIRMVGGGRASIMQAVAADPRSRIVAVAADAAVQLWDVADTTRPGMVAQLARQPGGTLYSLAFSPDGNLVAAAGADQDVHIWNTADPTRPVAVTALSGPTDTVFSVVFSPNGRFVAAGSADGIVRIWDVPAPTRPISMESQIPIRHGAVKSVAFDPSSPVLATGDADGTITLWDIADLKRPRQIAQPAGPTKEIGQVAFSPDGHLLAAGGHDTNVYLWDVTNPSRPTPHGPPLTGAHSWINAVTFSPDGRHFAAASSDPRVGVRIWDTISGRVVATLIHPAPVTGVEFTATGTSVATTANDGTARLWPLYGPIIAQPGLVSDVAFSPNGRLLAVGSTETDLWNVSDPDHPIPYGRSLPSPDHFSGTLAFTPDSRTLAVSHGASGTIQLWDVTDPGNPARLGPALTAHPGQEVVSLAFSPDGHLLATGSLDHTVRLWDVTDSTHPRQITSLSGFQGDVSWVAFSPDGHILAASSSDRTVRLWDVGKPDKPRPLGGPLAAANTYIYCVVFSPDGHMLATGSADASIRLWDLANPAKPALIGKPLTGPTDYVYLLAFRPDGHTLAAAVTDGTVWLWDVSDPHHPTPTTLTLPGHTLYTVAYRPDDHTIAAGGTDATVWIWDTDTDRAARLICRTSGTAITRAEWARYVPDAAYQPPCNA